MSGSDTVEKLVSNLKPKRAAKPSTFYILWLLVALMVGAYYIQAVGVRMDLAEKFHSLSYLLSLILFCSSFLLSGWMAIKSSFPGRTDTINYRRTIRRIGFALTIGMISYAGIWTTLSQYNFSSIGDNPLGQFIFWEALGCCWRITKGMMLPVGLLALFTMYLVPTDIWRTAVATVVSGGLLTAIVSQLNCPIDNPMHILIGHGVLLAVTGSIVLWLTGMFLNLGTYLIQKLRTHL